MNGIINKSLLAVDTFMPKMLLRKLGVTYSAFGPFNKNTEYKNLKKK